MLGTNAVRWLMGSDSHGHAADDWRCIGYTLFRVWFGFAIFMHGYGKLFDADAMEGMSGFVESLGFPMPLYSAYAAKGAETFGGLLVAAGLLTRIACIPLIITLAVAAFLAHGSDPLISSGGASKEPALHFLVAFAAVFIVGPGKLSLDALLKPLQPKHTT